LATSLGHRPDLTISERKDFVLNAPVSVLYFSIAINCHLSLKCYPEWEAGIDRLKNVWHEDADQAELYPFQIHNKL